MKPRRSQIFFATLSIATLLIAACGLAAAAADQHLQLRSHCHYCGVKTCRLKVEKKQEDVPCFTVECKDICIPPVTFPWECRPSRPGKVRTINVLKSETYEKTVCKYSWEVVTICPTCRGGLERAGCDVAPGVIAAEFDMESRP
ncbi:hypothetical protein SH139x_000618 [Planctomycetaceae bacterium SH139]